MMNNQWHNSKIKFNILTLNLRGLRVPFFKHHSIKKLINLDILHNIGNY